MLLEEPNYIYSWSKKSTTEAELLKMVIIHFSDQNPHLLLSPVSECKKAAVQILFGCSMETHVNNSSSFLYPFFFFTNFRFSVFSTLQIRYGCSQSWSAAVLPALAERVALPYMAFQSFCNLIFMDSVGWNGQHNCPSCGMTFWVIWGIMNKIALFFLKRWNLQLPVSLKCPIVFFCCCCFKEKKWHFMFLNKNSPSQL